MKSKQNYLSILTAFIAPAIIFAIHLLSINFGFYILVPNLDVPMHFAGGMAIAVMAIQLLNIFEKQKKILFKSPALQAFLLLSIVGFIAGLWELSEFAADQLLGWSLQFSLFDTMKDMIMGLTGGTIVIISWIYGKTHK